MKIFISNQKKGNFLYNAVLKEEEAVASLQQDEQDTRLLLAALHLRSLILQMPKTKTPSPANVENLMQNAPNLPLPLQLFFKTLIGSCAHAISDKSEGTINRKAKSIASDTVYNVTHGSVKSWKHTVIGLGFASQTGSKTVMQILNRSGHCISYSGAKILETEFTYSLQDVQRETTGEILLQSSLATACVWDNNDANIETLHIETWKRNIACNSRSYIPKFCRTKFSRYI